MSVVLLFTEYSVATICHQISEVLHPHSTMSNRETGRAGQRPSKNTARPARLIGHRHHLLDEGFGEIATLEIAHEVREILAHGDAQSLSLPAIYESIESGGAVLSRPDFTSNFEGDACECEVWIFAALDCVLSQGLAERDTVDLVVFDNRPCLVGWTAFDATDSKSLICFVAFVDVHWCCLLFSVRKSCYCLSKPVV